MLIGPLKTYGLIVAHGIIKILKINKKFKLKTINSCVMKLVQFGFCTKCRFSHLKSDN